MKTRKITPFVLLIAACSSATQQPAQTTTAPAQAVATQQSSAVLNPAGTYEIATVVDGQTVTGTMKVEGTPGNYKGVIQTNLFPEIPIVGASVESNIVHIKANMPDGELAIRLVMDGMNFNGSWALGGGSGEITGKKSQ